MLKELEKLIATEKESKLQIYINKLLNDLFNNKELKVNSKELLELLSYLTSEENMSTSMKTAIDYKNKHIENYLNKERESYLKGIIEKQRKIIREKDNKIKQLENENIALNKLIDEEME